MKLFVFLSIYFVLFLSLIDARRLIVIRHGEKISDDYLHLNSKGKARAQCLHKIFNTNTIYGKPQSIYSNKRGSRSHRPYDTVKPLADRYGLRIKEFKKTDPKKFVKDTLNRDKSNIILLSSAREWIPSLLKAIGYRIKEEVDDFDNVWVIENDDKKGHGKLSVKKQNLESCIKYYLAHGNTDGIAVNSKNKKGSSKKNNSKNNKTKNNKSKKNTKKSSKKTTTKKSKPVNKNTKKAKPVKKNKQISKKSKPVVRNTKKSNQNKNNRKRY
ncbi:hypothetical protein PIROE2DRAFT_20455 [Piromyces sp. E2]|nr:hypothetical protein PIROE2DRAFT_20455 [Piromyces sp. E2]|eukprot:OUM64752.1 hypothetical protein PIROE2DRAFT_20455 [Piromyces sp. E2]